MENRSSGVGQYILVQRTSGVAPRASSAPPSNNPNMVIHSTLIQRRTEFEFQKFFSDSNVYWKQQNSEPSRKCYRISKHRRRPIPISQPKSSHPSRLQTTDVLRRRLPFSCHDGPGAVSWRQRVPEHAQRNVAQWLGLRVQPARHDSVQKVRCVLPWRLHRTVETMCYLSH